jgi:CheY-like chemotaxis protein
VVTEKAAEVLVVDDDPDVREFTGFLLASKGYAVQKAFDGQDAMERMTLHAPDVVVLDIMMPRLDGRGVLRAMKADDVLARVPVVIISGASDLGAKLEGCSVLRKPVSPAALIAEVARCLAEHPRAGVTG